MPSQRQLVLNHVHNCIKPTINYFNLQRASTLNCILSGFKAAHFFYPQKAHEMQPTALCIDFLTVFPFFCTEEIETLKSELPLYLSKVANLDSSIGPLKWWRHNADLHSSTLGSCTSQGYYSHHQLHLSRHFHYCIYLH